MQLPNRLIALAILLVSTMSACKKSDLRGTKLYYNDAHLLKAIRPNVGTTMCYEYEFDAGGKITLVKTTYDQSFTAVDRYSYTCY